MNPHEVFAKIHEIESTHRWLVGKHIEGVADPAIWGTDTGESIAEIGAKNSSALIVLKSTVNIGFTETLSRRLWSNVWFW